MNERIRELADQILPNEREFNKGDPKDWGYFFSGEELEKFTESLIRQCMDLVKDCYAESGRSLYQSVCASTIIEEHFGIEE